MQHEASDDKPNSRERLRIDVVHEDRLEEVHSPIKRKLKFGGLTGGLKQKRKSCLSGDINISPSKRREQSLAGSNHGEVELASGNSDNDILALEESAKKTEIRSADDGAFSALSREHVKA